MHYGITLLGNYHVEDINEFVQREMRKNCHYDKANDKDNMSFLKLQILRRETL